MANLTFRCDPMVIVYLMVFTFPSLILGAPTENASADAATLAYLIKNETCTFPSSNFTFPPAALSLPEPCGKLTPLSEVGNDLLHDNTIRSFFLCYALLDSTKRVCMLGHRNPSFFERLKEDYLKWLPSLEETKEDATSFCKEMHLDSKAASTDEKVNSFYVSLKKFICPDVCFGSTPPSLPLCRSIRFAHEEIRVADDIQKSNNRDSEKNVRTSSVVRFTDASHIQTILQPINEKRPQSAQSAASGTQAKDEASTEHKSEAGTISHPEPNLTNASGNTPPKGPLVNSHTPDLKLPSAVGDTEASGAQSIVGNSLIGKDSKSPSDKTSPQDVIDNGDAGETADQGNNLIQSEAQVPSETQKQEPVSGENADDDLGDGQDGGFKDVPGNGQEDLSNGPGPDDDPNLQRNDNDAIGESKADLAEGVNRVQLLNNVASEKSSQKGESELLKLQHNSYQGQTGGLGSYEEAEDSHFFAYFMSLSALCILAYLVYHNKRKIIAMAVEGKKGRNTGRRRPNSASYHKLDSNLEEAMSSNLASTNSYVIY